MDIEKICVLCQKPLGTTGKVQYMGNLGRDLWAHSTCYQERYHPAARNRPEEKQAEMELG